MSAAATHHIRLLTAVGCHLCDTARDDIARIAGELGVGWDEVDIASDADLLVEYAEQVPVILIDGRQHGYWRVEEQRLRRALAH